MTARDPVSRAPRSIDDLLALYGVYDAAEREPLLALARRANEPGWWHRYGDLLPAWFETYVGLRHAGAGGPFSILRFPCESAVPDVVYLEQRTSALYLDKRTDVDDYLATMEMLCAQALPPRETRDALVVVRDELGR